MTMSVTVLDTKGLSCPLPVLRAKKAIQSVPAGGTLQVLATDSGAVRDFEAFCRSTGNQLLDWREEAGVFTLIIKKVT
jgi:tRNA 2-thiouridine synthesizing protein A